MNDLFTVESFGTSDVGLIRKNNEDVFRVLPKEQFYILADGMGGHNAGEIAAAKAVEYMCSAIQNFFFSPENSMQIEEVQTHMGALIENTNLWVHHLGASDPSLHGMGTTLCSILLFKNFLIYSHVGDSRIYRYRNKELSQLTKDHIVAKEHPPLFQKRRLAQAIGTSLLVSPEVDVAEVAIGDLYLLCSDGLTDFVTNKEISSLLEEEKSLDSIAHALIDLAKKGGGHDNITLVLLRIKNKPNDLLR